MRVLIIEQLSEKLLADHARLISGADVRIPLTVGSGVAAAAALKQGRWWVENLPLFEAEAGRHARWVHRLVQAQKHEGELADERSNGLIAYGLEVRLRHSVLAQAYVRQAAEDHGHAVGQINLDVLGDDPYLRDTFTRRHVVRQFRSVALHSTAATRSWVTRVRVRAAASPSIRKLVVARQALGSNTHSMTRSEDVPQTCRTAALFVQNQQSINLFRPVREELHSSGWRVRIFRYDEFEDRDGEAESFELAVQGAASCGRERLRMPAWTVADDCLDESPVSRAWLRVALNASWLTGWEQFVRHRRLLSAQRPNVVISYSVDAVALGLQAAAESLGIPSLFINHGSLGPTLSPWFFQWTALALAGRPCVDAHVVGPFGQRNKGLVPVGYPPYDAMLAEVAERGSTRPTLGDLAQPMGRPHIIVAFVEYGHQFWVHVLQRRLLRMVAECLPPDCFLVCKLHPAGEHEREPCEKLLSSLLAADAFEVIGERQYTTPQLLAGCHVAVAIERCGALTDAILMGRPAVGLRVAEIPPGSSNLSHVALLPQFWRCCRVVDDGTGMRDALLTLTRDRAAGEALWENRREYIESMFLASDGRASQRVADLIRHLGRGKGAEGFVPAIGASLLEERDDA